MLRMFSKLNKYMQIAAWQVILWPCLNLNWANFGHNLCFWKIWKFKIQHWELKASTKIDFLTASSALAVLGITLMSRVMGVLEFPNWLCVCVFVGGGLGVCRGAWVCVKVCWSGCGWGSGCWCVCVGVYGCGSSCLGVGVCLGVDFSRSWIFKILLTFERT